MKPLRPIAKKVASTGCQKCDEKSGVNPLCVACCVRWFRSMPGPDWMSYNAPLLVAMTSAEHLDLVRAAFKEAQTAAHKRKSK